MNGCRGTRGRCPRLLACSPSGCLERERGHTPSSNRSGVSMAELVDMVMTGVPDARRLVPADLEGLLRAQFGLRMQLATQQLSNTSQMKKVKRDIARVRTIMREKASK